MRTLMLLRHGKAAGSDPAGDHTRALSARGRQQAGAISGLLSRLGLVPDLALVSDARRTRETAELALAGAATHVEVDPGLYAASPDTILAAIRAAPDSAHRVLVVGHNPGIGEAGRLLEGSGEPQAVIALHESFPTAALAVFEFDGGRWTELAPGTGCLTRFIVPNEADAQA